MYPQNSVPAFIFQGTKERRECQVDFCVPECPRYLLLLTNDETDNTMMQAKFSIKMNETQSFVSKVELEIKPLDEDESIPITLTFKGHEYQVSSLRRDRTYRPNVKVYTDIQVQNDQYHDFSQLMKSCQANDFKTEFWKCQDSSLISASAVCDNIVDCADGSDEIESLCKGEHMLVKMVLGGCIAAYLFMGLLCILILELGLYYCF